MGEYETKYGNVIKEDNIKRDQSRGYTHSSGNAFYGDPRKKIKDPPLYQVIMIFLQNQNHILKFYFKNLNASDESGIDSPLTDRSLLQSSSSAASSETSSLGTKSARPKTTKRLDTILHEDLRLFGAPGDSRLSTPSSTEDDIIITRRRPHHFGVQNNFTSDKEKDSDPLKVGELRELKGRVTILDNVRRKESKSETTKSNKNQKSKIDNLLDQEQDDLAMSLSHSKFLQLKNANLERVKADDLSPDIGEFQQLERMMTKISFGNIEAVDDKSPSDTFENIPDDVFEKIPRAVTARLENRQKKLSQTKPGLKIERDKPSIPDHVEYQPSTPSAPVAESPGHSGVLVTRDRTEGGVTARDDRDTEAPVGIIAMLFSGGPVVTRTGEHEQVSH